MPCEAKVRLSCFVAEPWWWRRKQATRMDLAQVRRACFPSGRVRSSDRTATAGLLFCHLSCSCPPGLFSSFFSSFFFSLRTIVRLILVSYAPEATTRDNSNFSEYEYDKGWTCSISLEFRRTAAAQQQQAATPTAARLRVE